MITSAASTASGHDSAPEHDPFAERSTASSSIPSAPAALERASRDVVLSGKSGLHARPAAKVVEIARRYASSVTLVHGDVTASAKDLLDVLYLAAPSGVTLHVRAEGFDAAQAVEALSALLSTLSDES